MSARQQEVPAIFGQRIKRERERLGWSLRELGAKADSDASTVMRIEKGADTTISKASALASAFGLPLAGLFAEPECAQCDGKPPAGFICSVCGREEPA